MTIFFTSDTHFGDHRVLNIGKRPFPSVTAMDEFLIAVWNECVRPDDEIWHLGDFARTGKAVPDLLCRLNGRKHLIRGNNDPSEALAAKGWESVQDYRELLIGSQLLVLCHYPFRSWNGQPASRSTFMATATGASPELHAR